MGSVTLHTPVLQHAACRGPGGRTECGAPRHHAARGRLAGSGHPGHPECRWFAPTRRQPADLHARRTRQGALCPLQLGGQLERGVIHHDGLPGLWQVRRHAPEHRLVRRSSLAHGRDFTALDKCDLFAAIGTSGLVYPAAGFASAARASGARCIEFNLANTDVSSTFHEHVLGPASETVPAWADRLITSDV